MNKYGLAALGAAAAYGIAGPRGRGRRARGRRSDSFDWDDDMIHDMMDRYGFPPTTPAQQVLDTLESDNPSLFYVEGESEATEFAYRVGEIAEDRFGQEPEHSLPIARRAIPKSILNERSPRRVAAKLVAIPEFRNYVTARGVGVKFGLDTLEAFGSIPNFEDDDFGTMVEEVHTLMPQGQSARGRRAPKGRSARGRRAEEPYAVIKRELQIASREIDGGKLAEAHARIVACEPTPADVKFWLTKSQMRKMREWQRGGQRAPQQDPFWGFIDQLGWGTKTTNYRKLKKTFMANFNADEAEEFRKRFRAEDKALDKAIRKWEAQTGQYVDLGDDSYGDLRAHIIGLGRGEYQRILRNPQLAYDRARRFKFTESFTYAIPSKLDYGAPRPKPFRPPGYRAITTRQRRRMPQAEFALPITKQSGKFKASHSKFVGAYPMNDKSHAVNARSRATQMLNKGYLSKAEAQTIYDRTYNRSQKMGWGLTKKVLVRDDGRYVSVPASRRRRRAA